MSAAVEAMLKQAKQLSADERAELIEGLQHIFDADALPESKLWNAWRPELARRRALLERGELETVDAREHIESTRARLRAGTK